MNKFLSVIIACVLLFACKPGIPKNIIQPDQMEKVLYDIHLVDGYSVGLNFPKPDSIKMVISPYYQGVYKKFGIDSALFNQSLDYYYKNPKLLNVMYDHITEKLTKARDKANKAAQKTVVPEEVLQPAVVAKPIERISSIKPIDSIKKIDRIKPFDFIKSQQLILYPATVKRDTLKTFTPIRVN